jgi:hypothetical protein
VGDPINNEDREFIWTLLADAFAGVQFDDEGIDKLRKFPIREIRRIFFREVAVACSFNLTITTPEMGGFDPQWVKAEISRVLSNKNSSYLTGLAFETKALFSGCISFGLWRDLKTLLNANKSH